MKREITEEIIEKMHQMQRDGCSYAQMSKELGLAKSTISAYLNGRIRNATIAQQNAILRAYNQQKTIQEIAEEQHVSKSIVEYTISTYRIRSKYEQKLEGYHYVLPKAPKYIVTQLHRGNLIGQDFYFDHFPIWDDLIYVCRECGIKHATDFINENDYRAVDVYVKVLFDVGSSAKCLLIQRITDEIPGVMDLLR